jgi:hypothetical protein
MTGWGEHLGKWVGESLDGPKEGGDKFLSWVIVGDFLSGERIGPLAIHVAMEKRILFA